MVDYLLALDPGVTTGFSVLELAQLGEEEEPNIVEYGTLSLWGGLDQLIERIRPRVIVMEQFRLYPRVAKSLSFSPLEAVQVIGVIKYLAEREMISLVEQSPQIGKATYLSRSFLRGINNPHAIDSIRHGTNYLRRRPAKK